MLIFLMLQKNHVKIKKRKKKQLKKIKYIFQNMKEKYMTQH